MWSISFFLFLHRDVFRCASWFEVWSFGLDNERSRRLVSNVKRIDVWFDGFSPLRLLLMENGSIKKSVHTVSCILSWSFLREREREIMIWQDKFLLNRPLTILLRRRSVNSTSINPFLHLLVVIFHGRTFKWFALFLPYYLVLVIICPQFHYLHQLTYTISPSHTRKLFNGYMGFLSNR